MLLVLLLQLLMLLLLLLQVVLVLLRGKVAAGVGGRRRGGAVAVVGIGMWVVVVRVVAVHAAYVHHIVQPEPHFLQLRYNRYISCFTSLCRTQFLKYLF